MTPSATNELREKILEVIKGYEPVGHLDGSPEQKVIESGYDLDKDLRTEFGFYWEYEDMEECADQILSAIAEALGAEAREYFKHNKTLVTGVPLFELAVPLDKINHILGTAEGKG